MDMELLRNNPGIEYFRQEAREEALAEAREAHEKALAEAREEARQAREEALAEAREAREARQDEARVMLISLAGRRFGPLSSDLVERIQSAPHETLRKALDSLLDVKDPEELRGVLESIRS